MPTYNIIEIISHPCKFTCMVSFNGKPAHYHEVESMDSATIDSQLMLTAAMDLESTVVIAEPEIKNGRIVIPQI